MADLLASTPVHPRHPVRLRPEVGVGDHVSALADSSQFASGPPYPLTSKRYTDDFNEVKSLGGGGLGDPTPSARTAEQTEIALFWLESSPLAWNRMARAIAADRGLDLVGKRSSLWAPEHGASPTATSERSRRSTFYNFWRPVTAIHRGRTKNGNPLTGRQRQDWQPLGRNAADP